MSTRTLNLTETLYDYVLKYGVREHPILAEVRQWTNDNLPFNMQISPEHGQFMGLLIKLTGARKALEVGVFTGYSSLVASMAMPEDGQLVACDISEEYTSAARKFWEKAGVDNKIDLRIAPATETLQQLVNDGQENSFDMAFIDADKTGYDSYYELTLKLLKPGGWLMIDNVLWSGAVADSAKNDDDTLALKALNQKIAHDDRVEMVLLPVSDGVTLIMKC